MYPSITQYATAISIPESFATKSTLRPVLKEDGTPYFSAGGYAVVFQMQCEETGKRYALKCFTREQEHRAESFRKISEYLSGSDTPYLLPYEYLENELWVEDADYPVLLMEWVDGDTLDRRLADLCRENDPAAVASLAGAFDALGVWLLEQELAHGDLKPDNIIIRPSGQPVLIDYDGMFVPAMAGEESRELGTQNWRHPQRKYSDFNRHLDDFPILVISLSLHVFAAAPDLYHRSGNADNLLFTEADFLNPYTSNAFVQARAWQSHEDIAPRLALLQYAVSLPLLQLIGLDVHLRRTAREVEEIPLTTTYDESEGEYIDEYGVKYNAARTKLVKAPNTLIKYKILPSTTHICDYAFEYCIGLRNVDLSCNLKSIGEFAFFWCKSLETICVPDKVDFIGMSVFNGCLKLNVSIDAKNKVFVIDQEALVNIYSKELIYFPPNSAKKILSISNNIERISNGAFSKCDNLYSVIIPNTVRIIGNGAFITCKNLSAIFLPNNLEVIGKSAFRQCVNLGSIVVPNSVKYIGNGAFSECERLNVHLEKDHDTFVLIDDALVDIKNKELIYYPIDKSQNHFQIPDAIEIIGQDAFRGCINLTTVIIPESILEIQESAFEDCGNLTDIFIPNSVRSIGERAFTGCGDLNIELDLSNPEYYLDDKVLINKQKGELIFYPPQKEDEEYIVPEIVKSIGNYAFYSCQNIIAVKLNNVHSVGECAFRGCKKLCLVEMDDNVISIGDDAFAFCESLKSIVIPGNVSYIGRSAFYRCKSLSEDTKDYLINNYGPTVVNMK